MHIFPGKVFRFFYRFLFLFFAGKTMTSNLVSMDISSDQEVNNNNQEKAGCSSVGIDPSLQVFNRKEADDQSYCSPGPGQVSTCSSTSSNSCSVYSLNDTFRIKVSSAEEWLCVARMPRDFTQTEFESLLDEFGPIQQCFLIHSEISGDLFFPLKSFNLKVEVSIALWTYN